MQTIDKINYYLNKKQKNGSDLCEYLGVSNGVYSQWNTGRTKPRKSKLPVIAEFLGVTVDDLIGDDAAQKEKPTAQGDGLTEKQKYAIELIKSTSDDDLDKLIEMFKIWTGEK